MITAEEKTYYLRQLSLHNFGEAAQSKLRCARVLVVGVSGLACATSAYIAGAGIGKIGIVDGDMIEKHNLHRQTLFDIHSVGEKKAEVAAIELKNINPHIDIETFPVYLSADNAMEIFKDFDLIADWTDNFAARYLINDVCVLQDKPFVYGAIYRFEGQVGVFNLDGGPTYRCLFPEKEENKNILSCTVKNCFTPGAITADFIANSIAKHQVKTNIGAHQIFLGQVRADDIDGHMVEAIEYTAFEEMANRVFDDIRENAFRKFDLVCMHIYHSLGVVKTGEICLFVFVSSKRRSVTQKAIEHIVEEIKAQVPIFGKEIFENKTHQWQVNT